MKAQTALILLIVLAGGTGASSSSELRADVRIRGGVAVGHVHPRRIYARPFFPAGFWAPAYGPAVRVVPMNYGRVDFNIQPENSKVYVDGAFIGIADDFNGGFFGSTATLKAGTHRVRIVAPDGRTLQRKIYVMPGKELNLNWTF